MAYKAIQAFEDEDDSGKALELAERIYREFCRPDSQMEVNISWDLREKIGAFFKEKPSCGDPSLAEAKSLLQTIKAELFQLMFIDTFRRFKQSAEFQEFKSNTMIALQQTDKTASI
jgi:hypothetical protein